MVDTCVCSIANNTNVQKYCFNGSNHRNHEIIILFSPTKKKRVAEHFPHLTPLTVTTATTTTTTNNNNNNNNKQQPTTTTTTTNNNNNNKNLQQQQQQQQK